MQPRRYADLNYFDEHGNTLVIDSGPQLTEIAIQHDNQVTHSFTIPRDARNQAASIAEELSTATGASGKRRAGTVCFTSNDGETLTVSSSASVVTLDLYTGPDASPGVFRAEKTSPVWGGIINDLHQARSGMIPSGDTGTASAAAPAGTTPEVRLFEDEAPDATSAASNSGGSTVHISELLKQMTLAARDNRFTLTDEHEQENQQ